MSFAPATPAFKPMGALATQEYSFFDPNVGTMFWPLPASYGTFAMLSLQEFIQLPQEVGYVDSVKFTVDQAQGDSIFVYLYHDTLINVPVGRVHLVNVFVTAPEAYGVSAVAVKDITNGVEATAYFPHVQVPKNFHVGLSPNLSTGAITSSFAVLGDREAPRPFSELGSRSNFVGVTTTNYLAMVLDSVFTPNGETDAVLSNLYIRTFVSMTPGSVRSAATSNTTMLAYPNPASGSVRIQMPEGKHVRVTLVDLLGREVLVAEGNSDDLTINTSTLVNGVYHMVVTSGTESQTTSLVVSH
jgi:hypothetical protein